MGSPASQPQVGERQSNPRRGYCFASQKAFFTFFPVFFSPAFFFLHPLWGRRKKKSSPKGGKVGMRSRRTRAPCPNISSAVLRGYKLCEAEGVGLNPQPLLNPPMKGGGVSTKQSSLIPLYYSPERGF